MTGNAITGDIGVVEICGDPGHRGVTVVASVAACDVGRVFTGCRDAVVAGAACAQNLGVIHAHCRRPYRRTVTVFANVGRLNVCGRLAGRLSAVVAADTVTDDVHMTEDRWRPRDSRVAVITLVATADVRWMFAGRGKTVVTTDAITEYAGVIEYGRQPGVRIMTIVALITR